MGARPRRGSWSELPVSPPQPRVSSRPPRVLVAEDDAEMRRLMIESLTSDGLEVVDAADGGQLLIHITSQYRLRPEPEPIDLIVTDIRMPIVSGLDIVRSVREAGWPTPIVMVTAFADQDTRLRASELGAVLLEKPLKMSVLRLSVRSLLAQAAGPDAQPFRPGDAQSS